jgi:hypothetical protein
MRFILKLFTDAVLGFVVCETFGNAGRREAPMNYDLVSKLNFNIRTRTPAMLPACIPSGPTFIATIPPTISIKILAIL